MVRPTGLPPQLSDFAVKDGAGSHQKTRRSPSPLRRKVLVKNRNPTDDDAKAGKPSWLKDMAPMNSSIIDRADAHYRARIAVIQGVHEIIEDVVDRLDKKGILNNTYMIHSSDTGCYVGNPRVVAGKSLLHREDTAV
ncbi:hypothetical protein GGR53DRAFT_467506 [Hypoxylon sp. FL1150]|nr:hypothetical protein GGR53DRAFT_467506 [Hypoxylon sp. FL1150]